MRSVFESRLNIILISALLVLCIALGVPMAIDRFSPVKTDETEAVTEYTTESVEETETSEVEIKVKKLKQGERSAMAEKVKKDRQQKLASTEKATEATEKASEKATEKTEEETEPVVFATAAPVKNKASYNEQWNKGYLIAIDNPDKSYSCPHIELSDENRDLLERLCMGEYGSGGFTGAALIAQAVKDAMATYHIDSVAEVIKQMRYDGKTNHEGSAACKKAVVYVFDMDKDAVQHRILYMYNPKLMKNGYSAFHEKQKYICNFGAVRFFDK